MAKNIGLLRELVSTNAWMMRKDAYQQSRAAIMANMINGMDIDEMFADKVIGYKIYKSEGFKRGEAARQCLAEQEEVAEQGGEQATRQYLAEHNHEDGEQGASREITDEEYINVMNVTGPVTRNGGACTFGSREHRDMIMEAADDENCLGHLFVIDTPGGSAWAKNDYQQAIDKAHEKGQPVVAFIDGMCCSAGMYLASMCDRVFYMNPNDEVGCVGVMCEMYTNKDGDTNTISQERFVEIYAKTSPDKNIEYRDAAQGDYTKLQAEIDKLGIEFKDYVLSHRPGATEEHVTGKVFPASEVEGALVDQQGTFDDAVSYILYGNHIGNLGEGEAEPKQPENPAGPDSPETPADPDKPASPDDPNGERNPDNPDVEPDPEKPNGRENEKDGLKTPNKKTTMSKNYQKIQEALNLEALESDSENGLYLGEAYADAIETALAEKENCQLTLEAKMNEIGALNAAIGSLKTEHEEVLNNLKAEHEQVVADMKAEHEKMVEELKSEHDAQYNALAEQNQAALDEAQAKHDETVAELQSKLAEKDAQIANLQAQSAEKDEQIKSLSENAPAAPTPAAPKADEGEEAKADDSTTQCIYTEGMTRAEKRAARTARMKTLRQ